MGFQQRYLTGLAMGGQELGSTALPQDVARAAVGQVNRALIDEALTTTPPNAQSVLDTLVASHSVLQDGPAAWLLNTQFNYATVPWICAHQVPLVPIVALIMAAVSLLGGFLSWRGYVTAAPTPFPDSTGAGRPHRFVALMGIAIAALFTIAILIHGAAGLVFHGCER